MGRVFQNENFEGIKDRNKNKFFEERYLITSDNYNLDDRKILIMSDIHYHEKVDKDLYKLLILYTEITRPDYIVMPGDQVETISFIDNEKEKNFFEWFIKSLAKTCPVIIIPGNHEIHNLEISTYFRKNSKLNIKCINYFESLNDFENVYFLNNEQINLDGINFYGFNPSIETYTKINQEAVDIFMSDFEKAAFMVNPHEYNVLLTHDSLPLTINDTYKQISDFAYIDLVISGHFHDGYLPKFLDGKVSDDRGLIFYPLTLSTYGYWVRGSHDFGRGILYISQGVRTFNSNVCFFNLFEKIRANDVETITLTRKLKK